MWIFAKSSVTLEIQHFFLKCFVTWKRLCVLIAKYYVWSDICIELDRNSDASFDAVTQGILDAKSYECFMSGVIVHDVFYYDKLCYLRRVIRRIRPMNGIC